MIKNDAQLASAREKLEGLKASRKDAHDAVEVKVLDQLIHDAKETIFEYTSAREGVVKEFVVNGIDALGSALVKARVAKRWSQARLGEELGVSEQMVGKDESRAYEVAGVAKIADTLDALDYELVGVVRPRQQGAQAHSVDNIIRTSTPTPNATVSWYGPRGLTNGLLPTSYSAQCVVTTTSLESHYYVGVSPLVPLAPLTTHGGRP